MRKLTWYRPSWDDLVIESPGIHNGGSKSGKMFDHDCVLKTNRYLTVYNHSTEYLRKTFSLNRNFIFPKDPPRVPSTSASQFSYSPITILNLLRAEPSWPDFPFLNQQDPSTMLNTQSIDAQPAFIDLISQKRIVQGRALHVFFFSFSPQPLNNWFKWL